MADGHSITSYVRDANVAYIGCACGWMTVSSRDRASKQYYKHNPLSGPADLDAPGGVDSIIFRRETS